MRSSRAAAKLSALSTPSCESGSSLVEQFVEEWQWGAMQGQHRVRADHQQPGSGGSAFAIGASARTTNQSCQVRTRGIVERGQRRQRQRGELQLPQQRLERIAAGGEDVDPGQLPRRQMDSRNADGSMRLSWPSALNSHARVVPACECPGLPVDVATSLERHAWLVAAARERQVKRLGHGCLAAAGSAARVLHRSRRMRPRSRASARAVAAVATARSAGLVHHHFAELRQRWLQALPDPLRKPLAGRVVESVDLVEVVVVELVVQAGWNADLMSAKSITQPCARPVRRRRAVRSGMNARAGARTCAPAARSAAGVRLRW